MKIQPPAATPPSPTPNSLSEALHSAAQWAKVLEQRLVESYKQLQACETEADDAGRARDRDVAREALETAANFIAEMGCTKGLEEIRKSITALEAGLPHPAPTPAAPAPSDAPLPPPPLPPDSGAIAALLVGMP